MSASMQIRSAISDLHNAIEQTKFSKALLGDFISKTDYSRALVQLWHIHREVEEIFDQTQVIQPFFSDSMRRTTTLVRDIQALGFNLNSFPPMLPTLGMLEKMLTWSLEAPMAMVGALYVLEGSRMGSMMIARPLAQALGVEPNMESGIAYHLEGGPETPARFRNLKQMIDATIVSVREVESLVRGAKEFMSLFYDLYTCLPVSSRAANVHFHSRPASQILV